MADITQSALTAQQKRNLNRMSPVAEDVQLGTRLDDVESSLRATDAKASVRLASTLNIADLDAVPLLFDGSPLEAGDRVLLTDQSTGAENGVYTASAVGTGFLMYDAQSAAFNVGATLTGGTSGATATIEADDDNGTTGVLTLSGVSGVFQDNETITDDGSTPGSATSNGTLGDWLVAYDNESGGPFSVGETLTGGTSSAVGVIVGLEDDGASGFITLTQQTGTGFENDEELTGGTSTATADANGDSDSGATGTLVRAGDDLSAGAQFFVSEGSVNADTVWIITTDDPIVVGTTVLTISQGAISAATLASTSNGEGASLVGLEDSGALLDATDVEAGIAEIAGALAFIDLTAGSEASDVIPVAIQLQDFADSNLSQASTVMCQVFDTTGELDSTAFHIDGVTSGAGNGTLAGPANAATTFVTLESDGSASIDVADVVTGSGSTVRLVVTLMGEVASASTLALTFD